MIDSTSIHVSTAMGLVENTKTSLDVPEALLLSTRLGFLSHEHLVVREWKQELAGWRTGVVMVTLMGSFVKHLFIMLISITL
ncbi:hypothetical protein HanXRQr2_Chr09g0400551 [Helianthus annuus]|uniref:Uncharacterized protein n=1 Tax=Helianthus annuus TaxID=4232 RepID=A0A9K3I7P1_HELAN|nr:hypothetical protein HanXRQr2_Chr09g0400551 [Helianthus annuus]KAJ0894195.1 hypothetical protein HanPSC8_Chr09g0386321 [Helianthus annuus]